MFITSGFSFAYNHSSQMIYQAVLHSKSLGVLITDYEVDQNNENWNKMKNLMNQNYQVAFLKATMNDDLSEYLGEYYDD